MKSGNLNFLEPSGPHQASNGTALPLLQLITVTLHSCPHTSTSSVISLLSYILYIFIYSRFILSLLIIHLSLSLTLICLPFYRSSFLSSLFIFSTPFLHISWQFQSRQSLPVLWYYWYGWAIAVTAGGTILPASQHTILRGLWSNSTRHKQPLHSLPLFPDCPTHTNDWNLLSSHYRGVYTWVDEVNRDSISETV